MFEREAGDDPREYVFRREWTDLPSDNNARLVLIALAHVNQPLRFDELKTILNKDDETMRDAIARVADMFLVPQHSGGEIIWPHAGCVSDWYHCACAIRGESGQMADIFISYSKPDMDLVAKLAAMFEADGWSVWWDKSLAPADKYRDEIMRQLSAARAVLCVWTATSIKSDWVRAEAARARSDGKLIPVKTQDLSYGDIPLPFGEMHTENLGSDVMIKAAVIAQLAKPRAQPSSASLLWKRSRYTLLSWFGIAGGAVSLVTNLKGVIHLARWAALLIENWLEAVALFWRLVLFFLPPITKTDALYLTIILFVIMNTMLSLRRQSEGNFNWPHIVIIVADSAVIALIFLVSLVDTFTDDEDAAGVAQNILRPIAMLFAQLPLIEALDGLLPLVVAVFSTILGSFIVFVVIAAIMSVIATRLAGFKIDGRVVSYRLNCMLAGVAMLLCLNYAFLWLERQPWSAELMK